MLTLALLSAVLAPTPTAGPAHTHSTDIMPAGERRSFHVVSDAEIIADGMTFHSWQDLHDSGYYHQLDTRCGLDPIHIEDPVLTRGNGADCSFTNTNPAPAYDPAVSKLRIPVVVHVIQNTSGTGFISESRVRSQIDILNEDFLAMPGTNGGLGFDAQIEFYLATEDPQGNATNGITYSTNNSWFNDSGNYVSSLAWDTNRYLNIYTNTAGGALGYVPNLPQGGIVGSNADRVVILYSTFGRNAPFSPYNLGRTATHEVGHYLGLDHTFAGGCASASNCSSNGDWICDTNPESSPTWGCPGGRNTCGGPAPFDNYMDYSDDRCMDRFTHDQGFRMRCTLFNYRSQLYSEDLGEPCPVDLALPFGSLDFFDIAAFVAFYNAGDPITDLDMNGSFNFFDVAAFITAFNAGCP